MLPLADDNPTQSYPVVNHLLIAANIGVFIWTLASGLFANDTEMNRYCFVPDRFLGHVSIQEFSTFFSAMFLHAGFAHLIGNMWYLYIFGDNVEDRMGKENYLLFYLSCGVLAALTHILVYPTSSIPSLGASGAISGVLAAYLLLFPGAQVTTWITWFFRPKLPAWVLIGVFFAMNCVNGLFGQDNQVGWFAHIGGFLGGMLLLKLVMRHAEKPGNSAEVDISQNSLPLMATVVIALYGIGVVGYAIYPHLNLTGKTSQTETNVPGTKSTAKAPALAGSGKKVVPTTTRTTSAGKKQHPDSHKIPDKISDKTHHKVGSQPKPKAKGPSEKSPH